MKCSVFIATSADGFIASPEGDVSWLHSAGNTQADMSVDPDMGFKDYLAQVDCMIMGRKCMEMISSFNLSDEQWPYGNLKIYVLSQTVAKAPENLQARVEMYAGDVKTLIRNLEQQGYQHAYIDGGSTITSFLNLQLINEMTITKAPVLLGKGIALFGETNGSIKLSNSQTIAFPNDFIQVKYDVCYE
ncbi:dihydrofolate reductase family protein [Motilimonas eburnea]|nr:dihydrofolate reductase family protein [Motilimonas eburnea]